MSDQDPLFLDDFPSADYGTWRPLVEAELGGASFEKALCHRLADGFEIEPLQTEDTVPTAADPARFPGVFPFTRGTDLPHRGASWFFGSEIADSDPDAARQALAGDLELGAELLWLRFGPPDGLAWRDAAAAGRLLDGVEPKFLRLVIDAGAGAAPAAALLFAWARQAAVPAGELRGCLGCDPLATLATTGSLPGGLEESWRQLAELAAYCLGEAPDLRAALVSTAAWHRAGATPAWELALGLAAGLETLRALEKYGIEPSRAAHQILFAHELGSEVFLEIAKLRAARLLWSKVVAASGAGEVAAADHQQLAISSAAAATRVDPWVNMLRTTAQTFAAALGGADGMVVRPWDAPLGRPEAAARRFALTSQYVLAQESHLRAVADPAGGSWSLESLTDGLARKAWSIAQEIEKGGGLAAAIGRGEVQARMAELAAARRQAVAQRKTAIVGASVFPLLGEERPARAARPPYPAAEGASGAAAGWSDFRARVDAAAAGAAWPALAAPAEGGAGGEAATAPPLVAYRPAEEFENLRLAADGAAERPRLFVARLGPDRPGEKADSRARAEFAAGVLPVAGVEVVEGGEAFADDAALAAAFRASGCRAALLAASDDTYAARAESAARALEEAGCGWLLLAGRPGGNEERLRAAGIDAFVFLGADLVAVLAGLLRHLEVNP